MRVYISGKISGIEEEAFILFEQAEKYLQSKGYEVVNPMKLKHEHDQSWQSYMKEDIKALCDCDAIYFLWNWKESEGAVIEYNLSEHLGLAHYFAETSLYETIITL